MIIEFYTFNDIFLRLLLYVNFINYFLFYHFKNNLAIKTHHKIVIEKSVLILQ